MTRGRPFQPGNKFGRGRPKGTRNKKTNLAQEILDKNEAAILAKAINEASTNPKMLQMLAGWVIRRQKGMPVQIGALPMKTTDDLDRSSAVILQKVSTGKISPDVGMEMNAMIETRRRILETLDLERRLRDLETANRR